jgi:heme exporter protein C
MISRVSRWLDTLLPPLTFGVMAIALYLVFVYVPTDKEQGIVQRIFYFHVPIAMMTYVSVGTAAVGSVMYLWRSERLWDRIAHAGAELAVFFCSLVLVTGPIWAKPIWGTWWTWDARLTATLILWLIFAAYLMLRSVSPGPQGARYAAVLAIVGAFDVPIINRAVYWWRTIHPAVLTTREGGTGLADPSMQLTLLVATIAFFLLFLLLVRLRTETLRLSDSVEDLRQQALTA